MNRLIESDQKSHGSACVADAPHAEANAELRDRCDAAEQRADELQAQLVTHAQARTELIHLVSHELRTPITIISGFARLMRNENHGALSSVQQGFAREISKACSRLDQFVGDLLDASPGADSPFPIAPGEADLHEILTTQLESLAPLFEERGIKLETHLHKDVSTCRFDERRIAQVTTNLLTNAIRYGGASGVIRIATAAVCKAESIDHMDAYQVSIEDNGPGISEVDRERIFLPYVRAQVQGGPADSPSGLGIGLAISRRIIQAHGGRIWVESGRFGGARFVFSLPLTCCTDGED